MRRYSCWLAGLCSAGVFAAGGEDKQVSLTIYNRDLALVEHVRGYQYALACAAALRFVDSYVHATRPFRLFR